MSASADKSKQYFPLAGVAGDGWSTEEEATATCFCGAVQMIFPLQEPGFVGTFVCNCSDCRKVTASMFASNFTVKDSYIKYARGKENLSSWGQAKTPTSRKKMTNFFCKTCGTLMYRKGDAFDGLSFPRVGTIDDFTLHETKLRPQAELFVKERVSWFSGVEGAQKFDGMM